MISLRYDSAIADLSAVRHIVAENTVSAVKLYLLVPDEHAAELLRGYGIGHEGDSSFFLPVAEIVNDTDKYYQKQYENTIPQYFRDNAAV